MKLLAASNGRPDSFRDRDAVQEGLLEAVNSGIQWEEAEQGDLVFLYFFFLLC